LTWQRNLGGNPGQTGGDANSSGTVDAADLAIWEDQFSAAAATASIAAVPEPSVAALAVLGTAASLGMLRRRYR
jgi:hypothetical protein